MQLTRVYAYALDPEIPKGTRPVGGPVQVSDEIRDALNETAAKVRDADTTEIHLNVDTDPQSRTSAVRDALLSLGFDPSAAAEAAALALAERLHGAMDNRSKACLCVATVAEQGDQRQVSVWIFPKEEAFEFTAGNGGSRMALLENVFSRTSRLRKAAIFKGRRLRNGFLRGRVVDFQANVQDREVADFWIRRFLDAEFSISSQQGTRMLAKALRKTYEDSKTDSDRDAVFGAALALRQATQTRWSVNQFANQFLQGGLKTRFLGAPGLQDLSRNATFDLDKPTFDHVIHYRTFSLDNGAVVSAPFTDAEEILELTDDADGGRHLRCEGKVVDEKVRSTVG